MSTAKVEENNEQSTKFNLPIILPCTSRDGSCHHCIQLTNFQLGMVINIGSGRPFIDEVSKNVEQLKTDLNIIDNMWANIAASAVRSDINDKSVTRCLVPVVSDSLIEAVKLNLGNFPTNTSKINESDVQSTAFCPDKSICRLIKSTDVDIKDVKEVMDNIINRVSRGEV